jgi:hypothetical protein
VPSIFADEVGFIGRLLVSAVAEHGHAIAGLLLPVPPVSGR